MTANAILDVWLWGALGTILLLRVLEESGFFSVPMTVSDVTIGAALWPLTLVLLVLDWATWRRL